MVAIYGVAVTGREEEPAYQLRLPQFEGPLDVLLHLIERRELEVTAISVAAVADQFLAHVAALEQTSPATLADFVSVAARLVLIKSRALLPQPPRAGEEVEAVDDAALLAQQLAEYRQARATALALAERQRAGLRAYERPAAPRPAHAEPPPLAPVSLADLTRAVRRRLLELPAEVVPLPAPRAVSLPEMVARVETVLAAEGRTCLSTLLWEATSRPEVIVTFIALLELIRRRRIVVSQRILFGEIEIEPWRAALFEDDEPNTRGADPGGSDRAKGHRRHD